MDDQKSAFQVDAKSIVEFLKWLVHSYGIEQPITILDIGCGQGTMFNEMAKLGWDVLGMEPNQSAFEKATEIANTLRTVRVARGGFSDIHQLSEFNLISAINMPFNYNVTIEERINALQIMHKALKPGGVMFFDIANIAWILTNNYSLNLPSLRESLIQRFSLSHIQHSRQQEFDFHDGVWICVDNYSFDHPEIGKQQIQETNRVAMINLQELIYFVKQQGFMEIRVFPDYTSRKPGRVTGCRILVSAQKGI